MNASPFDTLPELSQKDALKILRTPLEELKISSDYYKAVFHLSKYPSIQTEEALLELLQNKSKAHSILIAKRKAIEVLGKMQCKKAIPYISKALKSRDPYLVENSAWALQEIGCADIKIHNLIGTLLNQPYQNKRVLIQSLSKMGAKSELSKIQKIFEKNEISPGVKGAAIAAFSILDDQNDYINQLKDFLDLPNQNDRQCAAQDVIDAKAYQLLEYVIETPISPFFRIRAITSLWNGLIDKFGTQYVLDLLDTVLIDSPTNIRILKTYKFHPNSKFLIKELFSPDFNHCFIALNKIIKINNISVWKAIDDNWYELKKDYGALYFLVILIRYLNFSEEEYREKAFELIDHCLDKSWPDFMKFKPQAIFTSMNLAPEFFLKNIELFLDEVSTPYWVSRYMSLICIERLLESGKNNFIKKYFLTKIEDPNQFVKTKAEYLYSKYL
ncbi:HEAT repeat domain-containing protein [Prochlorococcus marinus]|uniref:HEAT repeat domain-containing protein n=1 Tax=Prochlorococcus marinus TaxID=1219 RepID=UPI0022B5A9E0|nr:bilin biosynthesis protein CpeY [Prochlorococcus marinus]